MPEPTRRLLIAAAVALFAPEGAVAQERGFCRAESAGAKGYVVERIAGRLHCVAGHGTMTIFLATDAGVVALDAPPALMDVYLAAIREVTPAPVTHLIYSHSHLDHIGGASRMPARAVRIAQEETARTLARRNDPRRPPPTRTLAVADTLRVGGEVLVLRYHGPNHDTGQLLVYAPRPRDPARLPAGRRAPRSAAPLLTSRERNSGAPVSQAWSPVRHGPGTGPDSPCWRSSCSRD